MILMKKVFHQGDGRGEKEIKLNVLWFLISIRVFAHHGRYCTVYLVVLPAVYDICCQTLVKNIQRKWMRASVSMNWPPVISENDGFPITCQQYTHRYLYL
jgi:hypothetical protein